MALAFEGAQSAALSNRRAVTAIIASTLSWSLDMFDLFILPYVVPAHSHDFRQGSDSTVRRCGRHVRSTPIATECCSAVSGASGQELPWPSVRPFSEIKDA